jgi:DNA-binding PadR family transcriptional regulator
MQLTYPTALVLAALETGTGYGFRIADVTGLRVGTVYPILRRLEREALVQSSWERESRAQAEGRAARRIYRLTAAGRAAAAEARVRYPAIGRQLEVRPGEVLS